MRSAPSCVLWSSRPVYVRYAPGPMTFRTVYSAAIIGCGRIADTIEDEIETAPGWQLLPFSHAGAYQRSPRTQLVAAADPNPDRRASLGRRRGVSDEHLYDDYRALLERENPDVVSVCVPTRHH